MNIMEGGSPSKRSKIISCNKMEESEKLECEDKQSRGEDLEDSARTDMQRCQSMEEYSKASEASVYPANHERPEPDAIEFAQRRAKLEGKRE